MRRSADPVKDDINHLYSHCIQGICGQSTIPENLIYNWYDKHHDPDFPHKEKQTDLSAKFYLPF